MIIVIVLAIIIVVLIIASNEQHKAYQQHIQVLTSSHNLHVRLLTEKFQEERSELLDRIQAPTFAEYKHAEIKMVKAQKDEEPKPSFVLE